jgi:hypothetical protein
MSYYERHIFFCLNQRENGEACCANQGAKQGFEHCKKRVKDAGLSHAGGVRVNKAGCLDRCAGGPVAVVYPEGIWLAAKWLIACCYRRMWADEPAHAALVDCRPRWRNRMRGGLARRRQRGQRVG